MRRKFIFETLKSRMKDIGGFFSSLQLQHPLTMVLCGDGWQSMWSPTSRLSENGGWLTFSSSGTGEGAVYGLSMTPKSFSSSCKMSRPSQSTSLFVKFRPGSTPSEANSRPWKGDPILQGFGPSTGQSACTGGEDLLIEYPPESKILLFSFLQIE